MIVGDPYFYEPPACLVLVVAGTRPSHYSPTAIGAVDELRFLPKEAFLSEEPQPFADGTRLFDNLAP